jgi:Protein of unknown function (DUF1579)
MRANFPITVLIFFVAVTAVAQKDDKPKKEEKTEAKKSSDAADLYPQPTDAHKALVKAEEGVWDATMKAYLAGPGQPPTEFKGVETVRAIADGLYVTTDFEADFIGGKKFKGHGITGYDVAKKKMVGVWADNMSTSIGTIEGDFDPANKTVTLWFESPDPKSGQTRKEKHVVEYRSDGHKVYTIFSAATYGANPQVKLMEIDSVRRKGSDQAKPNDKEAAAIKNGNPAGGK